jgi:hypothetical protein
MTGRRSRRDRDAALLLLFHPVHGRVALMDLTQLVVDARIEKDPFGRRRLAGVDMSHYTDISCVSKGIFSGHSSAPFKLPSEMCKGFVGLCHLMGIFAFFKQRRRDYCRRP